MLKKKDGKISIALTEERMLAASDHSFLPPWEDDSVGKVPATQA